MVLNPLVSGRFSQGAKEWALGAEKLQLEEAGRLFAAIALMSVQRSWLQALTLLVAIAAAVAVTLYQFVPPAVVTANAPATEFSAERAMEDVRMITEESHPMGSSEHEEVADYIVDRLQELGISPQVQETTGLRYNEGERFHVGRIKNILARIPGTDTPARCSWPATTTRCPPPMLLSTAGSARRPYSRRYAPYKQARP